MMRKSYHETNAREEQFGLSKRILLTAFETKQDVFMDEFSEIAMAFDNYKSTITTQMIYVLNCLSKNHDLKVMANKFANLQEVSIGQMTDLKGILTQEDLSYYIVLVCLSKLSRNELKENVLTNSAILSLLEQNPDTVDILADFMLGRFEKLQRQLNQIE